MHIISFQSGCRALVGSTSGNPSAFATTTAMPLSQPYTRAPAEQPFDAGAKVRLEALHGEVRLKDVPFRAARLDGPTAEALRH